MAEKDQDKQDKAQEPKPNQTAQREPPPASNQASGAPQAGVVPTSGPPVYNPQGEVGQNPYTDPPSMARRRFYEDPVPRSEATEQQVLQGRGAPPPYPADEPAQSKAWDPKRYPEQMQTPRPDDSPQPTEGENLTVAQLLAKPREEQDRILEAARKGPPSGPPQYKPTSEYVKREDESEEQREKIRKDREAARRDRQGLNPETGGAREGESLRMAPANPGTVTAR
jgi:hypothetical protein